MRLLTRTIGPVGACLLMLSGCGGGGSSGVSDVVTQPVTELTISGDSQALTGGAVGLVATLPQGSYRQYSWTQLSGPTVELLSAGTAGIGFDASQAGSYQFRFTATRSDGSTLSKDASLTVTDTSAPQAQLRVDRAVSEGAEFSLRLNATGISNVSGWSFRQLSGPSATLETSSSEPVLFVTAPQVSGDAVMTFEGTAQTDAGTLTDTAYVVVRNRAEVTSPYFCNGSGDNCATTSPLAYVRPYRSDSPYASVLANCVYSNQLTANNLCTINTLPPLGLNTDTPSVDAILDRVLVSNAWMGERFAYFLENLDPNDDFKTLLGATTAIVISSDVRPSFYWALTGTIYLDPDSLWLTPAERDLINEQPDYRAGFGDDLQFVMPWRYVKDDAYAFSSTDPQARQTRTIEAMGLDLGSLLYHELSHANDFMSQAKRQAGLSGSDTFLTAATNPPLLSDQLTNGYPLQSNEMYGLGQVRFFGDNADVTQQGYLPSDVAGFFFPDRANDFYNYASTREDLAMLFEETMMKLRYGIDRDIAVTNNPASPTSSNDYLVYRGQRNRIGAANIRPRALFAVQNILPQVYDDAAALLTGLTPTELCSNEGWLDNLTPACATSLGVLSEQARVSDTPVPYRLLQRAHDRVLPLPKP